MITKTKNAKKSNWLLLDEYGGNRQREWNVPGIPWLLFYPRTFN